VGQDGDLALWRPLRRRRRGTGPRARARLGASTLRPLLPGRGRGSGALGSRGDAGLCRARARAGCADADGELPGDDRSLPDDGSFGGAFAVRRDGTLWAQKPLGEPGCCWWISVDHPSHLGCGRHALRYLSGRRRGVSGGAWIAGLEVRSGLADEALPAEDIVRVANGRADLRPGCGSVHCAVSRSLRGLRSGASAAVSRSSRRSVPSSSSAGGRTSSRRIASERRWTALLEVHGLGPLFTDCVTKDDPYPRKPDPASILALIARHGLDPRRCLAIGDRELDVVAGVRAGVWTCFFGEAPHETPADLEIIGYDELLCWLGRAEGLAQDDRCAPGGDPSNGSR
jgi:hypothetical protein